MRRKQVQDFCLGLAGSEQKTTGEPSNIQTYKVGTKKFAYFKTSDPERWRFSIRVSPDRFLELTDQPGIKPARYMHRFHWVTIVNVEQMDSAYLQELIIWSYHKALAGLSKKLQRLLAGD